MNKEKQYIILAATGTILLTLIIGILMMTTHQTTDNDEATTATSSSTQTKKDSELDKVALPQLESKVTTNESEIKMTTTAGEITLKLFNQYAPLAVENFLTHTKSGYYNNTSFHRVIAGFMIQGGDPKGNGTGGTSIWHDRNKSIDSGHGFKNEISQSLYNIRGALTMANAGPDTNGSQFFINQNPKKPTQDFNKNKYPSKIVDAYQKGGNPSLDGSYTVFGQVIKGMNVVDKIASAKVKSGGEGSTPVKPIKITQITILKQAN
ncbi:peptidylprolyl isomerase [Leuconostoc gelidum subsp. gelidum]|uniref:Peptidyl-prolyl cis-trans isomerase n=1 Tax=Leuconostoc gelidum subsp. gelidum TaxID=1607839 RepID=A0ABS7V4V5_LEUGE|nr:peptidylprolyl isomerase [Leuconostoc gelidum]MBZ5976461.1 peptidylprolyl isomerase [Leuconostoc gelidum subsp. gelidum]MBZ5985498.1 peptidylprolyl isomerase [Leuconostoc gelidum subsp. gelidum]MBZ6000443.1 peptidylprolyl isomerase [Leuconostoc gelidum subsp. gelidum]